MLRLISLFSLFLSVALNVYGAIELPSVIANNMVLQQNADASLWGKADQGSEITVSASWLNSPISTHVGKDGRWKVALPTPAATTAPQTIVISGRDSKGDITRLEVHNILIGEVWYCSGQSNMEIPMRGYKHQPIEGGLDAILDARAERPIRMFTVGKAVSSQALEDCEGHWGEHTPDEVAECSATAYYFADHLSRALGNIPVGVIISAWGGTNVQPWMSPEVAAEAGLDLSPLDKPVDRSTPDVLLFPSTLYNAMAAPVLPYTVKGMLWYQGENNCYDPDEYRRLMPYFVDGMRKGFGNSDLPFYYVQVAPFDGYGNVTHNVGKLRVAQSKLMQDRPACGMAVTLDIGDPYCIHPANKRDVGKRLAYWALAKDYGINDFAWSGPVFDHMDIDGERALLWFTNTGGGVSPLEQPLEGFEAAGDDGVYYPAEASVLCETGTLTVTCDKVKAIKKVRYGHAAAFKATLFDNFGLPASPFVTSGELE